MWKPGSKGCSLYLPHTRALSLKFHAEQLPESLETTRSQKASELLETWISSCLAAHQARSQGFYENQKPRSLAGDSPAIWLTREKMERHVGYLACLSAWFLSKLFKKSSCSCGRFWFHSISIFWWNTAPLENI